MKHLTLTLLLVMVTGLCHAGTVAVRVDSAELYRLPAGGSHRVIKKLPRFYPLTITESTETHYKVTDYANTSGWIEKSQVAEIPAVIVTANNVNLRRGPGINHPVAMKAFAGVTFKVIQNKEEWLQVAHESGQQGWIYKPLTWGQ